ncbi:hypothetical protein D9Q98_008521 [Chlorella vulgaris]|uniref:Uncharacterized protein n=1 Tax=Chlorella vulgaris TaxID=3077 RepID=A0A9D4TI72_CHLVU|nr:hypothetical protein D9Q98_008521 [Chlorella vulgaris]
MNGTAKPPGRSRPTNNQLLYKAHFRWHHYTSPLEQGTDLPEGTEACASVTSAFLQVLATIHRVEANRTDRPRNVLQILSTNTRRTKVVELSTGTHRVADELRRHSLSDGEGGAYSTNLDRNRYGSDNNYLFTVTRYNLEVLGMCPCLVDIEIVDTRNGNESNLVTAGQGACACDDPGRKERADASHFTISQQQRVLPGSPPRESIRRVASAGHMSSGGLKRVPSGAALRRPPSAGNLQTQSRNSGGSELFDALLQAATGADAGGMEPAGQLGDPPVTSRQYASAQLGRQRSRMWATSHNEVDSLAAAMEDFQEDEEGGTGGRMGSGRRRMLRRNSVSMILENPVLAQTGTVDSLILNAYPPFHALPSMHQIHEAAAEREHSTRSAEGDTEGQVLEGEGGNDGGGQVTGGGGGGGDEHQSFRQGLLRHFHKQSSAANLTRMANPAELRRLQDEVRQMREESKQVEGELEESRIRSKEAEDRVAALEQQLAAQRDTSRRAADVIVRLKRQLGSDVQPQQQGAGAAATAAATAAAGSPGGASPVVGESGAPAAAGDAADVDFDMQGLSTSEEEIQLLRAEVTELRSQLKKAQAGRKEAEQKLRHAVAANSILQRHPSTPIAAAAAAAAAAAGGYALPYGAYAQHMLQMPPLNPYGGIHPGAFRPPVSAAMQKVASMPILAHPGMLSPQAAGEREGHKRRAESPIPEDDDEAAHAAKKRMTQGPHNGSTSPSSPVRDASLAADEGQEAAANGAATAAGAARAGIEAEAAAVNGLAAGGGKAAGASGGSGGGKKSSHETDKMVEAMLSDGVGTMLT